MWPPRTLGSRFMQPIPATTSVPNNTLPCALGPAGRYPTTSPNRLVDRRPRVSLAFGLSADGLGGPVTCLAPVACLDCGSMQRFLQRNEMRPATLTRFLEHTKCVHPSLLQLGFAAPVYSRLVDTRSLSQLLHTSITYSATIAALTGSPADDPSTLGYHPHGSACVCHRAIVRAYVYSPSHKVFESRPVHPRSFHCRSEVPHDSY